LDRSAPDRQYNHCAVSGSLAPARLNPNPPDQLPAPEAPTRIRIAVAIKDQDFADALVSLLRDAGYMVVEEEVADYLVMQVVNQSIAVFRRAILTP